MKQSLMAVVPSYRWVGCGERAGRPHVCHVTSGLHVAGGLKIVIVSRRNSGYKYSQML
jgi:hypothetical protein